MRSVLNNCTRTTKNPYLYCIKTKSTYFAWTALILSACSIYNTSPYTRKNTNIFIREIGKYGIQNVDTLTDVGCGIADHDKVLAHVYPNLFLVLENEPVHNRVHLKTYLKKNLKNTRFSPSIQSHYLFVEGTPVHIPLADGSQKTVLCRKVIHDFSNISKMSAEMARLLPKGGTLIVVEPDPVLSGSIDPRSKNKYLSKTQIDSLFKVQSLQLVSADTINYDGIETLNILKFTK